MSGAAVEVGEGRFVAREGRKQNEKEFQLLIFLIDDRNFYEK